MHSLKLARSFTFTPNKGNAAEMKYSKISVVMSRSYRVEISISSKYSKKVLSFRRSNLKLNLIMP